MNNLLGGCPLAWCYKFLRRCSVANVVKFLLEMRVLQAPANEQIVLSFLDRMGGENEISRGRKVRIDEGTVLVWLDWWDANNTDEDVEWWYLKLWIEVRSTTSYR